MADPFPTCYLNGEYLPIAAARISPLDRGFLFGDGAYEVMPVYGRRPFRFAAHCARLTRSLAALHMDDPLTPEQWRAVFTGLIEAADSTDLYLYWQVTRGAESGRAHAPLPRISRTVFAFAAPWPSPPADLTEQGVDCITAVDTRWSRCDIKSTALLANVLLRQLAVDAGATETLLLREGRLTDASASAVHVVVGGEVLTPPNSHEILPSTTRTVIEELASRAGVPWRTAPISAAQLRTAQEIWISAATREVQPVTRLDGQPVGTGRPGALWQRVHAAFQQWKRELQGEPW
ncbi:MAG: aminotransferase class IV [Steroidobacteraceae bacterium]